MPKKVNTFFEYFLCNVLAEGRLYNCGKLSVENPSRALHRRRRLLSFVRFGLFEYGLLLLHIGAILLGKAIAFLHNDLSEMPAGVSDR